MSAVVLSPLTVDELKERIEANSTRINRLRSADYILSLLLAIEAARTAGFPHWEAALTAELLREVSP